MNDLKYAQPEIERRMLVDAKQLPDLSQQEYDLIEDHYFDFGRMRLRKVSRPGITGGVYKLCKKYGAVNAYEEPIVNIYLTAIEYEAFHSLPGDELTKRCYRVDFGGHRFRIDMHTGPLAGLYLCEIEATSVELLKAIPFPPFTVRDVTEDSRYSGASLARQKCYPLE